MNDQAARIGPFIQAGVAAQLAVDRAIERAELVRLVRDRGATVRALAEHGTIGPELDAAIAEHSLACGALDAFDHLGRAPA